ncbi:hypothetical protein [Geomicrobium sp. JCM 19039]|nr:hypothetical protein [Geomicrobium sp. JCM 19039]
MAQHHEEFEFEGKRALTERQFEQLCTEHKPKAHRSLLSTIIILTQPTSN